MFDAEKLSAARWAVRDILQKLKNNHLVKRTYVEKAVHCLNEAGFEVAARMLDAEFRPVFHGRKITTELSSSIQSLYDGVDTAISARMNDIATAESGELSKGNTHASKAASGVESDCSEALATIELSELPTTERPARQKQHGEGNECLGEVKPTKQDVPSDFETVSSSPEEKGQSRTVDNVVVKLMSVYTNNLTDERFVKVQSVLANDGLIANDKLEAIDSLMPIPPSASAKTLGKLLGVSKQAVAKLDWWKTNRKDKLAEEVGKRESKLKAQAGLQDFNEVDEFD